MAGADRCPDIPQLNNLIQGSSETDDFLDLSNYQTSSLSVIGTQYNTIQLNAANTSQPEYYSYNPNPLPNDPEEIHPSSFQFNLNESNESNQLAYTQPDSIFDQRFQDEQVLPDLFTFHPQSQIESRHKFEANISPTMGAGFAVAETNEHTDSFNQNYTVGVRNRNRVKMKLEDPADSMDLNTYIDGVRPRDAYLVHLEVMSTLDSEVEFESHFLAVHEQFKEDEERERKTRRNQGNIEWKAGTSFGYLGLGKQKTMPKSYQKRMPKKSCFGIINMRPKNAWKRRPNKPKRSSRRSPTTYDE